jgi:hypothetical protein
MAVWQTDLNEGGNMPAKGESMIKTTLRLPERLWKETLHRSIDEGRSAQEIVAEALETYLKNQKRKGGRR